MDYFKKFNSNTLAGSGNQYFFRNRNSSTPTKSCILYKAFAGGSYSYSFLFSNTIDSTYSNGAISHKNLVIDSWVLEEVRVGVSSFCDESSFEAPRDVKPVLFSGQKRRTVNPGELFHSDPVSLEVKKDEYIYLEITFSGETIPYHKESIIPSFTYQNGEWAPSYLHPYASMIGFDRDVKKRIAFLGDSITQGCGTPDNSYTHWNAVFAEKLGDAYSYWNLGLGYGRADDAASDGMWLFKAKQNDIVFVCYGVNDILQGYSADDIKKSLQIIVNKLNEAGATVIIQTVPPFDYSPKHRIIWNDVNRFILNDLQNASFVYDCVVLLRESENEPHRAKYGGHPNPEGCKIWGESLFDTVVASNVLLC